MKTRICTLVCVTAFLPAARLSAAEAAKPQPNYQVQIQRDVMVRMRDGVLLATDLYIPMLDGKSVAEKLPAVLQRTPYDKLPLEKVASFFASHLIDVHPSTPDYPAGFALPLTDGVLRARYRDSFSKPSPLRPRQVYPLEFPLEPTANVFKAGHRIRVDVCSSNFPAYDINRNTGDPGDPRWRIAENTVFHGESNPSAIILPIAPDTFTRTNP